MTEWKKESCLLTSAMNNGKTPVRKTHLLTRTQGTRLSMHKYSDLAVDTIQPPSRNPG